VIAACSYAFPLDRLIQRLKFSGYLAAVPLLADLLLEEIERAQCRPDAILALPLSRERLRERGFNPSLELARVLARETGIALMTEACVRVRHGQAQSALASSERQRNVRGAFACTASLHGLSIAVVDDVLTTGSTLNEVASVLRKSGAERVRVLRRLQTGAVEQRAASMSGTPRRLLRGLTRRTISSGRHTHRGAGAIHSRICQLRPSR
jgi:ComF family protein